MFPVRVLMLGWEFPPFISGGLGTACHGLTRAMTRLGAEVLFVLPRADAGPIPSGTLLPRRASGAAQGRLELVAVPASITSPYGASMATADLARRATEAALATQVPALPMLEEGHLKVIGAGSGGGYEGDLLGRITDYATRCMNMTKDEQFDLVHAHDWVTFPAGQAIAARTGRPLIVHVHSTEFDRSGEVVNQAVYDIERQGMHAAAAVIAVSNLTKRIIVERYGVPPEKVHVVHNGIEPLRAGALAGSAGLSGHAASGNGSPEKTVLFLGRLTMQKGPSFFVDAAARILRRQGGVRFIIAGWGDLAPQVIHQVAAMGLGTKIRFTGFLRGREVEQAYRLADVYVMPSVSEPFGLTALEAVQFGVPVILSKNSGAAEVLHAGAMKCDFWDVDKMASQILSLLASPELGQSMCRAAAGEIRRLTWGAAARKCVEVYEEQLDAVTN
jgi:glycosyltransferase involved in cell wall biosynthesis